jgi:crotonobetainyl-CoA:carnitine CoA-transferase CaiB-like acyl-CoA transferase
MIAPLEGVRVIELARLLPGPWATCFFADYGADVIKVEQPGRGDYSRHAEPRYVDESVYFTTINRNKRSITLDLTRSGGQEVLHRLAATADVVVESFRPGVVERLGADYQTMRELNARLIYCSVTGFGQTGPYRSSAGHDLNIAGMSGLLRPTPDRVPVPDGFQMADFAAASNAVFGVLLALRQRESTGLGQYLDISMLDSLLPWTAITGASAFADVSGHGGQARMEVFGANPRYSIYECRDGGYVSVSLLERSFWERLVDVIGRPDLINPNETDADRLGTHGEFRERYHKELSALFLGRDRDEWVSVLSAVDVPCWPVYEPGEVPTDPHVISRGMLHWFDDPIQGRIPQWASPIRSDQMTTQLGSAPRLGEHNDEVLHELGFGATDLDRLRDSGVG